MNDLAGIISLCQKNPRVGAITVFTTTCLAPLVFSFIALGVGAIYMDAVEMPFEYLGREPYVSEESVNVDVTSAVYGGAGDNYWAYIADSEEEYVLKYGACGMSDEICEQIDFDDYILVMSVNRPLTAIRVMKSDAVLEEEVSSYPQFVFGREEEKNMVYYYKVYRIDTVYKRYGQKIENRLKLFEEPYAARNSGKNPKPDPMVEPAGPFKKWRWAFALFNHI